MKLDKAVDRYAKQVGLREFRSREDFAKHLERRYGTLTADSVKDFVARRAEGELVDIYPLIHQSLDLSIDCLGAFQSTLHKNYLRWLSERAMQNPARILDLGCGNGFLTCFYASLFPESDIVGADQCREAVRCANELKNRVGAHNVGFVTLNSPDGLKQLEGSFDLITMVNVAHELISVPRFDNSAFMNRVLADQDDSTAPGHIAILSSLLVPSSGTLLSVDKWSAHGYCWWVSVLHKCGLAVDFSEGRHLDARWCGEKGDQATALLSRRQETSVRLSDADAIAFWLHSKYRKKFESFKPVDLVNEFAEAGLLWINPKSFRLGVKVEPQETSGLLRLEIWQAGPFLLVFQHRTDGYRSLEIVPTIFYSDAERHLREIASRYKEGFQVTEYREPEIDWDSTANRDGDSTKSH